LTNENHIDHWQLCSPMPERFSDNAPYAIAINTQPDFLFSDNEPYAGRFLLSVPN